MKKLLLIIMFISFLASGCASPPKVDLRQYTGRPVASPSYTLKDMQGNNLTATFYYTAYTAIKDIDGTGFLIPNFLNLYEKHKLNPKKIIKVTITIEVWNPNKITYSLWERTTINQKEGGDMIRGGRIAMSKLKYRLFNYNLPFLKDFKEVKHGLVMVDSKGCTVFHFGDFKYEISS